jgi:predicted metal-binding protein
MLKFPAPFANAIFVCTNKRPDGHPKPCCADRGGRQLRDELKNMVREKGLEAQVRIFQSGCLGGCERGVMAVKYPAGELMMDLKQEDLQKILDEATGD